MTPEESKQFQKLLRVAASTLGEHFNSVQIHASVISEGMTASFHDGSGDWFARQGLAHLFIETEQAETNAIEIQKRIGNDDDDEESWKKS